MFPVDLHRQSLPVTGSHIPGFSVVVTVAILFNAKLASRWSTRQEFRICVNLFKPSRKLFPSVLCQALAQGSTLPVSNLFPSNSAKLGLGSEHSGSAQALGSFSAPNPKPKKQNEYTLIKHSDNTVFKKCKL